MTEIALLLLLLITPAVVAACLSGLIIRLRPSWSLRKTVVTASLPISLVVAFMCGWRFLEAATAPLERCRTDVCAITMAISLICLCYAFGSFLIGDLAAARVKRSATLL